MVAKSRIELIDLAGATPLHLLAPKVVATMGPGAGEGNTYSIIL